MRPQVHPAEEAVAGGGGQGGICHRWPHEPGASSQQSTINFVRGTVKEVIASTNSNLTMSLLKLLDCFFRPFLPREVQPRRWSWGPLPSCLLPSLLGLERVYPASWEYWIMTPPPPPPPSWVMQGNKSYVICPLRFPSHHCLRLSLTLSPSVPRASRRYPLKS